MLTQLEIFGYEISEKFKSSIAYFSMEFAVDQSLKIYSGGLGFLAGSHLRSAFELKQNLVGIGILWKYGYYDQLRNSNLTMNAAFIEKEYSFLKDTGITITVEIHGSPVFVKAFLLESNTFNTAPLFLLTTDIPENDYLAQTITHHLYDANEATRIAQSIVLGTGGATLLDALHLEIGTYHMNEGHSVSLNFYLYSKYKSIEQVREKVVFTTHTPEQAGNEEHRYELLKEMSFFHHLQVHEVKYILGFEGESFNYTLGALKFARKANAVSKLHAETSRQMWGGHQKIAAIIPITNSQNQLYWQDKGFKQALEENQDERIISRKKEMKKALFKIVADQTGKLFREDILTIVWARRFAGYKRADLIMHNLSAFKALISNKEFPVQIIWAGKPYPKDEGSVDLFNSIILRTRSFPNCAVLTGYELELSAALKKGSDVWLNNPMLYKEASGTSGMTAAMNGSINFSIPDGWMPEFAVENENCFLIKPADINLPQHDKDFIESSNLMEALNLSILPTYYYNAGKWLSLVKKAEKDVVPMFESSRMVIEYYEKMYHN